MAGWINWIGGGGNSPETVGRLVQSFQRLEFVLFIEPAKRILRDEGINLHLLVGVGGTPIGGVGHSPSMH